MSEPRDPWRALAAPSLLVLPSHGAVLAQTREATAGGVLLGAHAVTFAEFLGAVTRAAVPDLAVASPAERTLAVWAALGVSPPGASPLGGEASVRRARLLAPAEEALRVSVAAGLAPETLDRASRREARPRLARLAVLLRAYEAELARLGRVDAEAARWRAARALADGAPLPAELEEVQHVVVRGVVKFSRAEVAVLHQLSRRLTPRAELVLELPQPGDGPWQQPLQRLYERFESFEGEGLLMPLPVSPADWVRGERDGAQTTAHVGAALVRRLAPETHVDPAATPAPTPLPEGVVAFAVAPDPTAEARVAAAFLRKHLEAGVDAERLAVVSAAPREARARFEDALEEAGVPVHAGRSHSLAALPIVRFVLAALRIGTGSWTTAELARLVENGYAARWLPEGREALVTCLRGVRVPPERGPAWLEASLAAGRTSGAAAPAARRVIATLPWMRAPVTFGAFLDAASRWMEEARLAEAVLLRGAPPPRLRNLLLGEGSQLARDEAAALGLDARALDALAEWIGAWRSWAAPLGTETAAPSDWLLLLERELGRATLFGAGGAGGVRVISPDEAAFGRFHVLVFADLVHGVFPGPTQENVFLRHEDAALLAKEAGLKSPFDLFGDGEQDPYRGAEELDRLRFLAALGAASDAVLLTRAATDADGGVVLPSAFWDPCKRAFGGVHLDELVAASDPDQAALSHAYGRVLRRAALRCRAGVPEGTAPRDLTALALEEGADPVSGSPVLRRVSVERARIARAFGGARGLAASDADAAFHGFAVGVGPVGAAERPLGVSAVERAHACRFKFFAGDVLGLSAEGSAGFDPDAGPVGDAAHRAFEAAIGAVRAAGLVPFQPEHAAKALAVAEPVIRAAVARDLPRDGAREATWARQVDRVVGRLLALLRWMYVEDDAGYSPTHAEFAFGDVRREGSGAPLSVPMPDGDDAFVGGRVDLLEARGAHLRVTDLKSSSLDTLEKHKMHPTKYGHDNLQLPLYVAMVRAHFGVAEVEARYLSLRDGVGVPRKVPQKKGASKDAFLDDAEVSALRHADGTLTVLGEHVVGALVDVRAGRFLVDPREGACDRCEFRGVCRRPTGAAEDEEGGDA